MQSAFVQASTGNGDLGVIMGELSEMRQQLSSLQSSIGSVQHDLGSIRDRMAMGHQTLIAGKSQTRSSRVIPPATNTGVAMTLAPLARRASRATVSLDLGRGGPLTPEFGPTPTTPQDPDENRTSMLAKMAEAELHKILRCNEKEINAAKLDSEILRNKIGSYGNTFNLNKSTSLAVARCVKSMDSTQKELILDSVVGFVILLNALFLGISADANQSSGSPYNHPGGIYLAVDVTFSAIFWLELIIKVAMKGCKKQFCSKGDWVSNNFDAMLIIIDSISLFFVFGGDLIENDSVKESSGLASLFRIVRLLRLARILRLLRSRVFQDLLSMIQGMLGGLATLGWSVVLFVIFIYVVSLIFRQLLGPNVEKPPVTDEKELQVQEYFFDVPRSMFTMFRCSFGDCTTDGGTPLFEHVTELYGGHWSLVYCCFSFVVVIGLFNVISAIFVESTMQAAQKLQAKKRQTRLDDETRWAMNVITLLHALLLGGTTMCESEIDAMMEGRCSHQMVAEILQAEFSRTDFEKVLFEDDSAMSALVELDIAKHDHKYLSDILDPDNSGAIGVLELVDGLKRLRGEPRRSDTIAIDLMVRSLQEKVDDIWRGLGCDLARKKQEREAAAGPGGRLMHLDPRTLQVRESMWRGSIFGIHPNERAVDYV